ncbi:g4162 [Coccomyxa elongata]
MIHCCNELNAGYAADGYARAKGVGCVVVTFTVGGLSAINAVAGAMSEHLPVICITGCPNSNDFGGDKILHHTIGEVDFSQELRCFKEVTCAQVTIRHAKVANEQIDYAISEALLRKKPVLIQVCSNMATETSPLFSAQPVPYSLSAHITNARSLEAAVDAAAEFLSQASKPVIVVGPQAKPYRAIEATVKLAEATKYATAVLPNAKGLFPETNPLFVGTYWGVVSTPYTAEVVDSASASLVVGPLFNDYNTVAFSSLISDERMVKVDPFRVTIAGKKTYGCINMGDFLNALREKLKPNPTVIDNYRRMFVPQAEPVRGGPDEQIKAAVLYRDVQQFLTSDHVVMADTGDCIFWTQKLKLPYGAGYEAQMQYGSIGWSVGAALGYSVAARQMDKRLILFVGDGCFQVTAQDVSTMIRVGVNPVIFLLNNATYVIEEEIHPGPYNKLTNWDYTALITAMKDGSSNLYTAKVKTEEDLKSTLAAVGGEHKDKLCFVEVKLHPEDCSRELLEWGARISMYNSRKPQIS